MGEEEYSAALAKLRGDRELMGVPFLAEAINNPETRLHPLLLEVLMHELDDDWHRERGVDFSTDDPIPAYFGTDWGLHAGRHASIPELARDVAHDHGAADLSRPAGLSIRL